jgi:hypothetical protein
VTTTLPSGDLLAWSLLSLLAVAIGAAVLGMLLWAWRKRRHCEAAALDYLPALRPAPRQSFRSVFSEPQCRWVAIRSSNLPLLQSALGLAHPLPCSWKDGISGLAEHKLFIAPPVRGWTLVVGERLPDPGDDIDRCFHFLRRLSRQLGHVQFFSVHRPLNHHAWARLDGGRVVRAYAWAGATLWNQGRPTLAEAQLGMKCFGYAAPADSAALDGPADNTARVPALAAAWSLDPMAVDERALASRLGVAGDALQFKSR